MTIKYTVKVVYLIIKNDTVYIGILSIFRGGKTYQLANAIQTGSQHGMQTLDQALLALCRSGIVSREEALARCADVEELKGMLDGSHQDLPL